ncbi:hypothetical protein [Bacillus wiedmannii]|nr:hypothetical protein [Bacillus wiedmannii]HDR7785245.1 hypothetical protein [Bacillus wiedmannii]
MRDKVLDLIIELSKSTKQVVAKDFIINELYRISKEDEEREKETSK